MPELPEVETVVRGLKKTVKGKTIQTVLTNAPVKSITVGNSFGNKSFKSILTGKKILDINRRGKNILITLSDNLTLWVHLKMTGHFFYKKESEPVEKHDLVIFNFKEKTKIPKHLRFNDYRRFGRLRLYKTDEVMNQKGLAELGPEPLTLDVNDFVSLCKKTSRMIKPALLDQSFIVGVGNIYADESLYASKIHPKKLTSSLSIPKLKELHSHIQRILNLAIDNMGSSVDTYTGINGKAGTYQAYLKAYKQKGEPCERCGRKIVRMKIGSRSAHFCPGCQKI